MFVEVYSCSCAGWTVKVAALKKEFSPHLLSSVESSALHHTAKSTSLFTALVRGSNPVTLLYLCICNPKKKQK